MAEFIALLPTITKVVEQVHEIVSKANVKKLGGYLSKDEVQKIQNQLDETKKNIEALRNGLYQAGKQVLDYKELYSDSIRADAICKQLLNLLSGYSASKKKGKPDNIEECLSKLYASLGDSLGDLNSCIKQKNLTEDDFKGLSKIMVELGKRQGRIESALENRQYGTARDSLRDMDDNLKDVNKTASDSMYGIIKAVVDKLEK